MTSLPPSWSQGQPGSTIPAGAATPYPYDPQNPYEVQPFSPGPPPGGKDRGGRAVLAAVLGALLAVAILGVAGIMVIRERTATAPPTSQPPTETTVSELASSPVDDGDRIGTSVAGIGLRTGDCVDFEQAGGNIDTFDIVSCHDPHLVEIAAQAEHPSAGQDYPGQDELARFAIERCETFTNEYLGADVYDTTLFDGSLAPDFKDWSNGDHRISCTVERLDGEDLTQPVKGNGSAFARGEDVQLFRLKVGDCFVPTSLDSALDLEWFDSTRLTDCETHHSGLFFGRGLLPFGAGEPYPGDDVVTDSGAEVCDGLFTSYFGIDRVGFTYRFWPPDQDLWGLGDRSVQCAVLEDRGLPATLNFSSYLPVYDLPAGVCFMLPPGRGIDDLAIDDQVETVDCGREFHGQMLSSGELPDGAYPGDDQVQTSVFEICDAVFADFVGMEATESSLTYSYWTPNEATWGEDDRRYVCAFLSDTPVGASYQGAAI
jgi:hypothetical protein